MQKHNSKSIKNKEKDILMKCPTCNRVYVNEKECPECINSMFNKDYILKPVIFLFLLLISLSFTQAALTDGLIGYWNLSNTKDSSTDPLDCDQYGVSFVSGKVANAGDFETSETDDIQCKESSAFDLVNTYTFNFWLKLESLSARQTVFVKDIETGGGSSGYWVNFETSVTGCSSGYCLCELDPGVERDCYDVALAGGSTYTMYTIMRNTTHMKWYINGTLKETDARSTNANVNNYNISIGKLPAGASQYALDGILDELGIWNRTLTNAEVLQLYNSNTGCDAIANPTGCTAEPPAGTNQTATPTLTNTTNWYNNITFTVTGSSGSSYLLYQNDTNVQNFTTNPFTRTGLAQHTRYGFKVKVYNTSYSTALSNFSALKEVWTLTKPNLTLYTDIQQLGDYGDGDLNPFVFHFNGTVNDATSDIFNCTMYSCGGGVSCMIPTFFLDSNLNTNITQNQQLNWTDWDGWSLGTVNITLRCTNDDITVDLGRDFYVDSYAPYITYNAGLNNTVFYRKVNTQLPYIIQFDDDSNNLYAVNTTLCGTYDTPRDNNCSQQIGNYHNEITGEVSRLINVTNLLSSLPPAFTKYFIFSQAWDEHTGLLLDKDFVIEDISTLDKAGVKIDNAIELKSLSAESITLEKSFDRYTFDFALKEPTEHIEFDLKSTGNLTYLPKSEYLGHFIDFENKKWIDFVTPNAESIDVTKISDYEYKVIVNMKPLKFVTLEEQKELTFESIGTLNYVNSYVYFNISNSSTIKARDRITNNSIQNITVKVYTYPNTLIQTKSTTNYNISLNITGGTYYLNISGNAGGADYITNITANHTFTLNDVYETYLTLSNSLYFTVYNEQTNTLITDRNVTIDVINYANESNSYTTATGVSFLSGFPAGEYEINYKATNFTPRSYYTTISGSDTQQIRLYLLSNLDSTHQYLNYDIVDDSAVGLVNSTISMQRYFISDSSWKTVEMSKSKDDGE